MLERNEHNNKKTNELNIIANYINPYILGITESNNDMPDDELGVAGYVVFRNDGKERRGWGGECYYTPRRLYQNMKYSYNI